MSSKKTETPNVTPIAKAAIELSRAEDFSELYANNVIFESSLWDLKLVFGQTNQHIGINAIVQHTAITIPWAQAKVLAFTLSLLLADNEGRSGRIQLKKGIIGEFPEQMPKLVRDSGDVSEATWKTLRKLYDDFIAANPELATK